MKKLHAATIAIGVSAVTLIMAWSLLAGMPAQAAPPARPLLAPGDCMVTSTLDSGPGSLRQCMLDLQAGATITFDTSIFPPTSPVSITLLTGLPDLITDAVTIDGSNAGVILDGSGIGTTPETLLLDDVSLTIDDGSNVIANGNFSAGLGHWRPQDDRSGATRGITSEARSAPGAYEWNTVAPVGGSVTVYDTTDISTPLPPGHRDLNNFSTVWIAAASGSTVEVHFWHKYGSNDMSADLHALFADGHEDEIDSSVGFSWQPDWTEEVLTTTLPADVVGVALIFDYLHTQGRVDGLRIQGSNGSAIRGLQLVNFPSAGISLSGGAQNIIIGGDRTIGAGPLGQGNLISGNGSDGMGISDSDTMSNTISGNTIGADLSGTSAVGNAAEGIFFAGGPKYNVVGGDTPGEGNLVSGNGGVGVKFDGDDTLGNIVSGNTIGTDVSGNFAIGNGNGGVMIQSGCAYNVIGGDTPGEGNLISGNEGPGIRIHGSNTLGNLVVGNTIGTNISGTAAISNTGEGIVIGDGAQYNVVGGDTPGERNLISGNGSQPWHAGVRFENTGTLSNTVIGNYIGTNAGGTAIIGNAGEGVQIRDGAQYNVVGGDTPEERNLISGNGSAGNSAGVRIIDSGSMSNTVSGNYIGTDVNGTAILGNNRDGVWIGDSAGYNIIGGATVAERNLILGSEMFGVSIYQSPGNQIQNNLISGNHDAGVFIQGNSSIGNAVRGNYIGTNINGTVGLGNGGGVLISNGAAYNVIGGNTPAERNLISGNSDNGVYIVDSGTLSNTVSGNYIGTDVSGSYAIPNQWQGVGVRGGASYTRIQDNLISGNGWDGVHIWDASTIRIAISDNHIGTNISGTAAISNTHSGIGINSGAHDNTIGPGNVIAYNGDAGVWVGPWVGSAPINNTVTQNSIYDNTNDGIYLVDGGNLELFPPILTNVTTHSVAGQAPPNSTVEIFSDAADEGRFYHGSTTADASGAFSFSQAGAFTGANVTATATDGDGNTSEFSAGYAPLVDAQVVAILQPKAGGKQGETVTPTVKVGNAGTTVATGISVAVSASGSALGSAYAPSAQSVDLPPLGYATLTFSALTPSAVGSYDFTASVSLAGDQDPSNDTQTQAVAVASNVIDLWTRDNPADTGDIPTSDFWQSPDLWVRHTCDGEAQHQDPQEGQPNCVYMRVRNRGDAASDGADTARVYWHEPSLGIKCGDWATIGDGTIATTPAHSGTRLLTFTWTPTRTGHTCLHGEIVSNDDPVVNACDIAWDNNLSQRNVDIIPGGSGSGASAQAAGGIVFEVTNIKDKPKPVSLVVDVSAVTDTNAVRLDLGSDLAARWASVDGLAKSSGVAWSGGSLVTITAATSGTIAGIPMAAGETQTVTLLVNAPSVETTTVTVYEAIDAGPGVALADAIVGGNTYIFNTETSDVYLPIIFKKR